MNFRLGERDERRRAALDEAVLALMEARPGARVRQLRSERGLTQAELAAASGVERSYLASVEGGRCNVTLSSLGRLACALDVSLARLFDGAG